MVFDFRPSHPHPLLSTSVSLVEFLLGFARRLVQGALDLPWGSCRYNGVKLLKAVPTLVTLASKKFTIRLQVVSS